MLRTTLKRVPPGAYLSSLPYCVPSVLSGKLNLWVFIKQCLGRAVAMKPYHLRYSVPSPPITFVKQRVVDGNSVTVLGRRPIADGHLLILRPVLESHHGPLHCCGDGCGKSGKKRTNEQDGPRMAGEKSRQKKQAHRASTERVS